jgi:DNA invertase Pin-like site-specific DNA recombinase
MKTALYARVSTPTQAGEEKVSLPTQILDIEEYCRDRGYTIVDKYVDAGYSGATKKRPEFQRMLKDAEAGKFDAIVCWKADRLSRGMYPAAALMEVIEQRNIKLEAVKELLDMNTFSIMAVVGKMELDNLRIRIRMGREGKAKQGKRSGGRIPFGYNAVPGGGLKINQAEADIIANMYESIANGIALRTWCKLANQQGIATKLGGKWASDMASRLCRDTKYIGKGYYGKKGKGDVIPMPYPRIVSDELFAQVQSKLRTNRAKSPCTSKHTYILSKLGRCHCGGRLGCRENKGYRYIHCCSQSDKPDIFQCYQPAYWRMKPIEDFIWGEVEDMLYKYRDGVNGVLLDNFEKSKALANEILENAEAELKRCGEEKQRLIRQVQKGIFTDGEVKSAISNIREREEHWQNELTNAQLLLHDGDAIWNDFMEKLEDVNRMYDWGGIWFLSDEQKKSVLNALVEEFILGPTGEIEIRYKLPVTEKQLQDTVASMLSIDKGRGPGG